MFNDAAGFKRIFLKVGYTDLRKGILGLTAMIRESFGYDPYEKNVLFLFCGHRTDIGPHHICVYARKTTDKIVKAFRPKSLLRNSIATPSLVASIMNAKYVNGMPLDRIATDLRRNDVNISKQVMANWVIRCSERYLSPVYFRLHELLLTYDVIQQDETPVEVTKDGRPANSKSFMWVYRSGKYHTNRVIILYEYQKTRKAEHPQKFLEGFHGVGARI